MSGENIVVWKPTSVVLSNGGSAIPNLAMAVAASATYGVETDGGGFPDAEFVLTGAFATAPTEGGVLVLNARPLDIDGTADAEAAETTRAPVIIGCFSVNNVTTTQSMVLLGGYARDVPRLAEYSIHNLGTGQQLSAGWTLKVTGRSYKAAP